MRHVLEFVVAVAMGAPAIALLLWVAHANETWAYAAGAMGGLAYVIALSFAEAQLRGDWDRW